MLLALLFVTFDLAAQVGHLPTSATKAMPATQPQVDPIDTVVELSTVNIVSQLHATEKSSSYNLQTITQKQLNESGSFTLSEALSKQPGISQLSTGNGISKPVIRGLYGNRILVLQSQNRFDNQQWQDEHGLGLSTMGIERVELIKGAAGVLYGSEAMGGVINLVEEQPDFNYAKKWDVQTRLYSNTLGQFSEIGYQHNQPKHWWRLRVGTESHADYQAGGGQRVLNSRFKGYYLKAGTAWRLKNFKSENTYNASYNHFGFIVDELHDYMETDKRYSKNVSAGPSHLVVMNIANSQNTFYLQKAIFKANVGLQSNLRMEDEGGGAISLNMHLVSLLLNLLYNKDLSRHTYLSLSSVSSVERNTNYGARILVPDANMAETGLSVFFKHDFEKIKIEEGLGINHHFMQALYATRVGFIKNIEGPSKVNRTAATGMFGTTYQANKFWLLKLNVANGYRAPNLAEWSSNGLREGVYRYEIGNRELKNESNFTKEISATFDHDKVVSEFSLYHNAFKNYIYLQASGEDFFGFPVYRYVQQDASIYGAEWMGQIQPEPYLQLNANYTLTHGQLLDKAYLPFIAPQRFYSTVKWINTWSQKWQGWYLETAFEYNSAQTQVAVGEKSTPAYALYHASLGGSCKVNKQTIQIKLMANNLFDNHYYDHLSRIRRLELYNPGRNIILSLKTIF